MQPWTEPDWTQINLTLCVPPFHPEDCNLTLSFYNGYSSLSPPVGQITSNAYTQIGNILYYLNQPLTDWRSTYVMIYGLYDRTTGYSMPITYDHGGKGPHREAACITHHQNTLIITFLFPMAGEISLITRSSGN